MEKSPFIALFTTAAILFITTIILVTYYFGFANDNVPKTGDGDDNRKNIPINSSIGTPPIDYHVA